MWRKSRPFLNNRNIIKDKKPKKMLEPKKYKSKIHCRDSKADVGMQKNSASLKY